METLFNILHVVAAVFLIGPMAILPMTSMRALRAGFGPQVASLAKSTSVFSWLSLIVVFFGFGLIGVLGIPMTTSWILWSIIAYVIALLINLLVVVPAMRRAAAELPANNAGNPAGTPAGGGKPGGYAAISAGSGISSLLLLVVVVLMVWKP